jgi:hypothetical protein
LCTPTTLHEPMLFRIAVHRLLAVHFASLTFASNLR